MPWHTGKTNQCPASKPYGVIKDSTGKVVPGGCHTSKDDAVKHMKALYANTDEKSARDANPLFLGEARDD